MTKRIICSCLAGALLLVGCSDEGKKGEYLPLEQVYAQADAALTQTYDNLTMPESITLDKTDTLYTFMGTWKDIMNKESDESKAQTELPEMLKKVWGRTVQKDEIKLMRYGNNDEVIYYEYASDDGTCASAFSSHYGFYMFDFSIAPSITEHGEDEDASAPESCIHIDRGEDLSAVYELSGGSCSVADALALCDETVEKMSAYGHPEEELRAKTVYIIKRPNGKYEYEFVYEKLYQGIPLDSSTLYIHTDTGFSKPSYWFLQVDAPDHISHLNSEWPNDYVSGSRTACKDSFLTLESAAELLSEELAQYKSYHVADIELKYICIEKLGSSGPAENAEFRPMWNFVLEEKLDEKWNTPQCLLKICAYVDMQNGKIYVVDDIYQNTYFVLPD